MLVQTKKKEEEKERKKHTRLIPSLEAAYTRKKRGSNKKHSHSSNIPPEGKSNQDSFLFPSLLFLKNHVERKENMPEFFPGFRIRAVICRVITSI
jgi:hypothetical protein